ncbi:MAG: 23S rRNA (adenine(2503)-C(2))-methyltransferase RlmN [Bacteroidia bacterium]|nr:23S rRNA (adenine(2503)-C(2))-methyltransferase RlmN [Bacteroidia bacterium]
MLLRTDKPNIRSYALDDLRAFFEEKGEKAFRANQVFQWVWQKHAKSFGDMTNLGKDLRAFLQEHFLITELDVLSEQHSNDGTVKSAFSLSDGKVVEGVLIPADSRMTACISSQVGCSLDCKFCATAQLKMMRNLNPDEIYDQVVAISRQADQKFGQPLSNIVFMGMGEPLLNFKNVSTAIQHIMSEQGLGMSYKRITVSTSGVAKMIRRLGEDRVKYRLAISLHAADNEKRSQIMSINNTNPLEDLADALKFYYAETGSPVTYEYILFRDFNDSEEDARNLIRFSKHVPSKINIIEYNPVEGSPFRQTDPERLERFRRLLENAGITATVRRSRGKDIDAACGQLANKTAS